MTGLQDDICDALMGAEIGPGWVGGPLHVAALVINPAFVLSRNARRHPTGIARALGWPAQFCGAVARANAALGTESERRALAVTLFGRVPAPGSVGVTALPDAVARQAAEWATLRAHDSACGPGCPLRAAYSAGESLAGERGTVVPYRGSVRCDAASAAVATWGSDSASVRLALDLITLWAFLAEPGNPRRLETVLPTAAAVEARVGGAQGAAAFCLTLAKKLGLTGS